MRLKHVLNPEMNPTTNPTTRIKLNTKPRTDTETRLRLHQDRHRTHVSVSSVPCVTSAVNTQTAASIWKAVWADLCWRALVTAALSSSKRHPLPLLLNRTKQSKRHKGPKSEPWTAALRLRRLEANPEYFQCPTPPPPLQCYSLTSSSLCET